MSSRYPVNLLRQLHPLVPFRGTHRNVLVLDKLTFPEKKILTLRLTERQLSGRIITLKIRYGDLIKAGRLGVYSHSSRWPSRPP